MNVEAIMTKNPVTIRKGSTLDRALDLMDEHDIRHLPVMGPKGVAGVISDRQLLEATGGLHPRQREALESQEWKVSEILQAPAVTVSAGDPVASALAVFLKRHIGCVPVLDNGELAGIVTEVDVLKAYSRACRRGLIGPSTDPRIDQHMTHNPITVQRDASGDEVRALMETKGVRHLPVMDGEALVGIVSDRDVRVCRGRGQLELTLVTELMSTVPETVTPETRVSSIALILCAEKISALPVVADGQLKGIATTLDVLLPCALALQQC